MAEIACLWRQCVDNGSAMCIYMQGTETGIPFLSFSYDCVQTSVCIFIGYGFFLFEIII